MDQQVQWTDYFEFLDDLRKSGVTNMWGAGPYLERAFEMDEATATPVLLGWMKTFSKDETPADRAAKALQLTEQK